MSTKDFVEERRNKILDYINKNKRANVDELALYLSVTKTTIRRDLEILDEQGLLHRVHGGALRCEQLSVWQISNLQDRMMMHLEEKTRIAQFVSQLVHEGDSLMIDGGSTTMLVAKELCA
jgi:DeoR/GlpR family transcriptional regulator of sugar metabolism